VEPPRTAPPPDRIEQRISNELDELDAMLLSSDGSDILDTSSIKTDTQALSYLVDRIQDSFSWDPYQVLGVEHHDSRDAIELAYTRRLDAISDFRKLCSPATKDYLASYLAILEEARSILTSVTLRQRFNQLKAIVEPQKKLNATVAEHKRSLRAFKVKRLALSMVHLKFAIYLDPRNAEYQYKLIYLASQNRRLWAMGKLLQEYCLEHFGTNPTIIALAGLLHHQIGNKIKARSYYERALKMDPEHELARQGINILNKPTRR
jgi:tetratricopeptide (TPR) repeat protein